MSRFSTSRVKSAASNKSWLIAWDETTRRGAGCVSQREFVSRAMDDAFKAHLKSTRRRRFVLRHGDRHQFVFTVQQMVTHRAVLRLLEESASLRWKNGGQAQCTTLIGCTFSSSPWWVALSRRETGSMKSSCPLF